MTLVDSLILYTWTIFRKSFHLVFIGWQLCISRFKKPWYIVEIKQALWSQNRLRAQNAEILIPIGKILLIWMEGGLQARIPHPQSLGPTIQKSTETSLRTILLRIKTQINWQKRYSLSYRLVIVDLSKRRRQLPMWTIREIFFSYLIAWSVAFLHLFILVNYSIHIPQLQHNLALLEFHFSMYIYFCTLWFGVCFQWIHSLLIRLILDCTLQTKPLPIISSDCKCLLMTAINRNGWDAVNLKWFPYRSFIEFRWEPPLAWVSHLMTVVQRFIKFLYNIQCYFLSPT